MATIAGARHRRRASGMRWVYDDGGRVAAGFRGAAGDCVTRSIAIALRLPYREVYDELHHRQRNWLTRRAASAGRASPRDGVLPAVYRPLLELEYRWRWTPTMGIGTGTTVHLRDGELPYDGPLVVRCSRHITAVIDGVVHDTHDPSRGGTRAVYGYWSPH